MHEPPPCPRRFRPPIRRKDVFIFTALSSFSQQIRGRLVPLLLWTNARRASCVPVPGSLKARRRRRSEEEVLVGARVSGRASSNKTAL